MGSGRWDPDKWSGYTTSRGYASKSVHEILTSDKLAPELDPKGVKLREARDSVDNPNSTALIVALDVTGSMAPILEVVAKKGLNTLVTEVYNRKPVTDPAIMCMGVGDVECDRAPLQITQFESDIRIAHQLEKLYLEQGGGGNTYESYILPWYFAAHHTAIDCFEKRGKRGYLFTCGDEGPTPKLSREAIERFLGYKPEADVNRDELLTLVSRQWNVFHIMFAEGNYASGHPAVRDLWTKLLGQQAIWLEDHTKLAETIVSIIQIHEGADHEEVVASWDGSTALTVRSATAGLSKRDKSAGGSVVQL